MKRAAFTLVELAVLVGILGLLAAIGWPVLERGMAGARSTRCIGNLRQIGNALNLYLNDHGLLMPTLAAGRESLTDPAPTVDTLLAPYLDSPRVLECPADASGIATRSGTSYIWNVALNGQPLASLDFLGLSSGPAGIPVLADKEGFHKFRENRVNILFADGRTAQEIRFSTP